MDYKKLAEAPVFRGLSERFLENFIGRTPNALREFGIGDFIALQGTVCQSLYLLYSGRVRTNMVNEEGKQVTIEEIEAPRLLAPAFIFATDNRFPVNITTLTNWEKIVMQNFLRIISDRSIFLSRKLNAFALQDLKTRLLAYLREHENPRSRQEIADILGVARPSLARVLSELADEGYLRIEKRKITVVRHKID